jgi:hypothetical protein
MTTGKTSLSQAMLSELLNIAAALGELRVSDQHQTARIIHLEEQILHLLLTRPSPQQEQLETVTRIKMAERMISILPNIWQAILWAWHLLLWMLPGVLAGWGMVEGWWAVGWRFFRAIFR